MTAEIVILNRSGVALAADSAITIGKERVWKSTNKLFHVSSGCDIAVMIYGNGDFGGIPVEVLIKEFRKSCASNRYNKLEDCSQDFVKFVRTFSPRLPNAADDQGHRSVLKMAIDIFDEISETIPANEKIKQRRLLLQTYLEDLAEDFRDRDISHRDITVGHTKQFLQSSVDELLTHTFKFKTTNENRRAALALVHEIAIRKTISPYVTAIVFAGFGGSEMLPSVRQVRLDGLVGGIPRVTDSLVQNMNEAGESSAYVLSFAQSDLAQIFMEGASKEVLDFVRSALTEILRGRSEDIIKNYVPGADQLVERELNKRQNSEIVQSFMERFAKFRFDNFAQPIMEVVASLPKDEMAAMAEALVETTSLRRKMDSRLETVGGPVDVAVVSKADGFVWIKRKHYFSLDINPDFMHRRAERYRAGSDDE
ncbi:hypothetical protein [Paracoccus salipaludis]|uniref:hypothetical protein n=1 Tax=Paracoccus salipaludis TaxID=2032623 RepID=UPI0010719B71|nr:hypothetical protein [Paracoccus salipaludis]